MPAIKVERCTLRGAPPKPLRQELAELNHSLEVVRTHIEIAMKATGFTAGEVWDAMLEGER